MNSTLQPKTFMTLLVLGLHLLWSPPNLNAGRPVEGTLNLQGLTRQSGILVGLSHPYTVKFSVPQDPVLASADDGNSWFSIYDAHSGKTISEEWFDIIMPRDWKPTKRKPKLEITLCVLRTEDGSLFLYSTDNEMCRFKISRGKRYMVEFSLKYSRKDHPIANYTSRRINLVVRK